MGRKKKEKPVEVKTFDYGDLAVVCKCGRTQIITKGVEKGLQIVLTTREDSFVQLRCDSCDADIKLCFIEGVKPEEPNELAEPVATLEVVDVESEAKSEEQNEVVQEESKQESSL